MGHKIGTGAEAQGWRSVGSAGHDMQNSQCRRRPVRSYVEPARERHSFTFQTEANVQFPKPTVQGVHLITGDEGVPRAGRETGGQGEREEERAAESCRWSLTFLGCGPTQGMRALSMYSMG